MRIDPKTYVVRVNAGQGGAGLICKTYNIDPHSVGVEYDEAFSSFENEGLGTPANRQATFKEQLRVQRKAASMYNGPRTDEQLHIETHLRDAYGTDAIVSFKEIAF
jgi:hypothetical protein